MNLLQHCQRKQWWLAIPLWGIDVPAAALCWGVAIAAFFQITLLTAGPLLLLAAMVWVFVLVSRVLGSLLNPRHLYAAYYRHCAAPMLLLGVGTLLAASWMLFFYVGQYLINFAMVPLLLVALAYLPGMSQALRLFCSAAAFVFACAAPASFFSFLMSPLQMFFSPQLWCLICLFLLFNIERRRGQGDQASGIPSSLVTLGLLALFLSCCFFAWHVEAYQQGFYVTIAMGAAALQLLRRLRSRLPHYAWYAVGWAVMSLPALLGVLIYAPEAWGL